MCSIQNLSLVDIQNDYNGQEGVFLSDNYESNVADACCNSYWWLGLWLKRRDSELYGFLVSTCLCVLSLLSLAIIGHIHSISYKRFNHSPDETMFFTHFLPLPLFVMLRDDLMKHYHLWNNSIPVSIPLVAWKIPSLWILCFLNTVTQIVCIQGVHYTNASLGTLTCTLTTTVRKFMTLVFSVLYFRNHFTILHWSGSLLVFLGTYYFATVSNQERHIQTTKEKQH